MTLGLFGSGQSPSYREHDRATTASAPLGVIVISDQHARQEPRTALPIAVQAVNRVATAWP